MREPSRILASATVVILLAAAGPAAAASSGFRSAAEPPTVHTSHTEPRPDADPRCEDPPKSAGSPMKVEWWRQWWSAATSGRDARQPSPEPRQPAGAPVYLRSPMMSGFFGWDTPNACGDRRSAADRDTPDLRARKPHPVNADSMMLEDAATHRR
ncbi:MAG: hypothetical protein ACREM1_13000 [Longimicrobiales bacterium]